jgi:hypothetical protein
MIWDGNGGRQGKKGEIKQTFRAYIFSPLIWRMRTVDGVIGF